MCKKLSILISLILMLVLSTGVNGQGIMREVWTGIGGVQVDNLTSQADFPDNPTFGEIMTSFEAPTDFADNFGSRLHGWLVPATSGDYTFWIAADDGCQLWLSTDDDPANAVEIAGHTSWTSSRQWDKFDSQKSDPVPLVGGQRYYVSALYKEGGGGDNLAVAWQGPDSPDMAVVAGHHLEPAPWAETLLPASNPIPADGAVDADVTALEWTYGPTAPAANVYLSTDDTIDDADLISENNELGIAVATLDPGVKYYWRVDGINAVGNVIAGNLWSFTTLPLEAHFPVPTDGGTNYLGTELSWIPGKDAIMHNVHFGTDPAALLPVQMMSMETSYDTGALDPATTYYWRVDEFTPAGTVTGPVWSFSTVGDVATVEEPNLVALFSFDEDASSLAALDTSGNGNHGALTGGTAWVDGIDGGALDMARAGYVEVPAAAWSTIENQVTIALWVYGDPDVMPANNSAFWAHDGSDRVAQAHLPWGNGQVYFDTGGSGYDRINRPASADEYAGSWRHWTFVKNAETGDQQIYLDGAIWHSGTGRTKPMVNVTSFTIGAANGGGNIFPGKIDDFRLYNKAFTLEEVRNQFADLTLPWDPSPANGAGGQSVTAVLSWNAGDGAILQDVYIGTDAAAVAAADATDTTGIYLGRQPETTAAAELAGNTTYYWRVDQLLADMSIVTGPVWSFSTARVIPVGANLGAPTSDVPGFEIYSLKAQSQINNFAEMNEILETGLLDGEPPEPNSVGSRIDEFVNLRDTGNGRFSEGNGYPDNSYPGVDPDETPAQDPAGGDDDNDFATEILGSIHLTAGMHRIGTATDDGVIVWVGGVEIGRSGELKGASNADPAAFEVLEDGYYTIKARTFERGGGASAELHQLLPDGTRILLNDVANGGAAVFAPAEPVAAPELVAAFAFGSRDLVCATHNDPSVNYTMVLQDGDVSDAEAVAALQYDAGRGYGYDVIYPDNSGDRDGYGIFGPFDDSPNGRGEFGEECPEHLYNSFIGAKNFTNEVSEATMGSMDTPGDPPEGIIFRVDVPNGVYRFVAAVGEADNPHAHRVLAEDGGSGPPENIGANYVVLVHNHDQAQYALGAAGDDDDPGDGAFARVGFAGLIPPEGDGIDNSPAFVDMGYDGKEAAAANSPALEVNQGYIRIHQLQGNSNDGPGGERDPNGGDIVILEIWRVR